MNRHAPPARSATYQDVLDAPPHKVAEIIDGALVLSPRPASPHALAASSLGADLNGAFQRGRGGPGGWWIIDEPELHFAAQVVVPDIAGWRREAMPDYPDVAYFEQAPDWVCEVLSPSTRRHDLTAKRRIYGEAGVRHLWLVDPEARTLEAFERRGSGGDGAWVLLGALAGDEEVRLPPFDAVALDLAALWPPEPPAEPQPADG